MTKAELINAALVEAQNQPVENDIAIKVYGVHYDLYVNAMLERHKWPFQHRLIKNSYAPSDGSDFGYKNCYALPGNVQTVLALNPYMPISVVGSIDQLLSVGISPATNDFNLDNQTLNEPDFLQIKDKIYTNHTIKDMVVQVKPNTEDFDANFKLWVVQKLGSVFSRVSQPVLSDQLNRAAAKTLKVALRFKTQPAGNPEQLQLISWLNDFYSHTYSRY